MDSAEQELVRLVVELERLRQRTTSLERRRDELAGYLASVECFPAEVRPAAPDWQYGDDVPVQDTAEWQRERERDSTRNLRAEMYHTGALTALSVPIDCPVTGCIRRYEHQHYADGQVIAYEGG